MTKQETLQKIIEKAVEGGWEPVYVAHIDKNHIPQIKEIDANSFIFSHDFLKAYFLDEWTEKAKEMVLETDPVSYLTEYLDT